MHSGNMKGILEYTRWELYTLYFTFNSHAIFPNACFDFKDFKTFKFEHSPFSECWSR